MAELIVAGLQGIEDVVANRYRIHSLLGQGGTGSTYQAEDLKTRRWVALKVMSLKQLGNWDLLTRFEREAEALGKIDHPGVPDYIEHFQVETADDCRFYLVQEFAAGKSLDQWVADGWRATEAEVKRIGAEVLNTLAYLHELDPPMIHRDIKPQNIIRQPDGRIYLVDFGAVQSVCRDALQQRGTFVGTMGYMPPEQLRGKAVFASDLYGLGATLVFLLTHRNPDELPMERMRIAFRGRVKLSEEFASWLEKMLEPMVKNRWESAEIALNQLQASSHFSLVSQSRLSSENPLKEYYGNGNIQISVESEELKIYVPLQEPVRWRQEILAGILIAVGQFALFAAVSPMGGGSVLILSCALLFFICYAIEPKTQINRRFQKYGCNWIVISPTQYSMGVHWLKQSIVFHKSSTCRVLRFEFKNEVVPTQSSPLGIHLKKPKASTHGHRLSVILSSGRVVQFAGDLTSADAMQLAERANLLLQKQRTNFASVD